MHSPIADNIKQIFLDNLLTTYEEMETTFAKKLYQFYKSFEFAHAVEYQRTNERIPATWQLAPQEAQEHFREFWS
ncbi:hypothetical protein OS493_035739 [Desmophyllum pertusum]|uniref:Uncharacterized protein n=1 Tax=Desmophyllum pertusum TaxID=174260 RepID=A0A9W9ZVS9_9CNID|nr:hypothetical protein OS493_035739 [Desmophyllum pertusum]